MKDLKSKNIFSSFLYERKNLSISYIIKKFGSRIIDVLITFPLSIIKENLIKKLELKYIDSLVTLDIKVVDYIKKYNRRSPFIVICEDMYKQRIHILYFNLYENQIKNFLKKGNTYRVSGKLEVSKSSFQIIHPLNIISNESINKYENIYPEYDLSRKRINKKIFRNVINNNIKSFSNNNFPQEWIPRRVIEKYDWYSFRDSLLNIHKPNKVFDKNELNTFRTRIAFDELLSSYLTFYELKKKFNFYKNDISIKDFSCSKEIIKRLQFRLTIDQIKALNQVQSDLKQKFRMYRLIQGDVGSGKTIIALLASVDVIKNGFQVVLMAPTEILARQHYEYFCEHLPEFTNQICLLTGKTKSKKNIYELILNDEIKILIGTHSVYNNEVKFKNLGLIIIDEQHKFGVKQRIKLLDKSRFCHTLIMSATPIPRSLSFVIYGEISISDIKTKPKGRKKVITTIINIEKIESLIEGIKRKIQLNEQIFWILPTINNEELNSKETVTTRFQYLNKVFNNKVSMIHGKMKKEELNKTMNDFKNKKISILVSTTLIEVGVNIPSATLIVIERAEMFGLAQLHQLRGRIVRGNLQGNCVLIFSDNLSEGTLQRLSILKSSENGFKIAEKDLEIRGAGDFFGTNQSGIPVWRFFNPSFDKKLIIESKEVSEDLVRNYNQNKEKIDFLREVFYRNENFMNYFSV